ncbi:MAG TPA: ABC transporter transmembrane domain-containing protein [Rhizobiaceae bacterium]|nr:ABC transporter transmembrane domain-containing protein [Rhizobiaceae bacterium]
MQSQIYDQVSQRQSAASSFGALTLAHGAGKAGLRATFAAQLARTVLRLGFCACAAMAVGLLVMQHEAPVALLLAVPALLACSAVAGLVADRFQATAETGVAFNLREAARNALATMPSPALRTLPAGRLAVAMQRHPEALAALAIGHRAAAMMMAAGPLAAAAALFVVSWQAALLILFLTPFMVIFFALVGQTIRKRADAQEQAFGRLAGQFADRIRTLPTILANHARAPEEAKLATRLETYSARTMGVLRVAFLNAGIIDFFASLSIAMLAVFLGLGHLKLAMIPGFSNLELWQSLFILMVAPEYFAPFRRFAEQYHARAEGLAAAAALDELLGVGTPAQTQPAALEALEFPLPETGLIALTGPSGSGKSTLLRRMAGVDPSRDPMAGFLSDRTITWIATDSFVPGGTLRDAILWETGAARDEADVLAAAGSVGLLDDALLPGGLAAQIGDDGRNLSGGQRLRIAVARAMLTDRTVIADEPTAKLDPHTASAVRRALTAMAANRLILVATHDDELAALADKAIALKPEPDTRVSQ